MERIFKFRTYVIVAAVALASLGAANAHAGANSKDEPKQRQVVRRADDQVQREQLLRRVFQFVVKQFSNDLIPPRP